MSKQNKNRLWLDLVTFVTLLIVSAPRVTGDTIHEWLALALSGAIVAHLLLIGVGSWRSRPACLRRAQKIRGLTMFLIGHCSPLVS